MIWARRAIDDDGTTRTGGGVEGVQAIVVVAVTPLAHGIGGDAQRGSNLRQRFATVEFEQARGTLKLLSRKRSFGQQRFEAGGVSGGERKLLFLDSGSLPEHS